MTNHNALHTPGPWHVNDQNVSHDKSVPDNMLAVFAADQHKQDCKDLVGESCVICLVAPQHRTTDIDRANARLIAAAPQLLAACKIAVDVLKTEKKFSSLFAEIVLAVAAAELNGDERCSTSNT